MRPSIIELASLVEGLPHESRFVFNGIFSIETHPARLSLPPQMRPWIERQFGSLEAVTGQKTVRVTNLLTNESSIFNPLRSSRPHHFKKLTPASGSESGEDEEDPFSNPLESTPEDPFGRVEGQYCITAGNVAKYGQYHCVIIFKKKAPLDFGCSEVADYIETAWRWARRAHAFDQSVQYPLFLWNCTNRAGASLPHGHAQAVMGGGSHYARTEGLRAAAEAYRQKSGNDYFDDLYAAHKAVGLALERGRTRLMAYLAPLKQNEVMLLSPGLDEDFTGSIYNVLACFRDRLNVKSFNLGIAFPPMGDARGWESFPVVARVVDRGDTDDLSCDIGAMEFYGANVISSDPFRTAAALDEFFKGGSA